MEKQKAYADRQLAKGMKKVSVWVPANMVERLKKYAERLRKEAEKQ